METESDGTIVKAEVRHSGNWGGEPALMLVLQIPDGRTTEPIYLPGTSQVDQLCNFLGARSIQELVGKSLRIVLVDGTTSSPQIKEVLGHREVVPDAFRRAFEDDNTQV